ncbi:hypothetical protein FLX56_27970 [Synechococcus moorigangaii CMS01]|nr:hypothetical protein [Synechococcus moorigangaii CMS01]
MPDLEKFGEFDGIQMGVLSDGTPFLTGRGLATLCGVSPTAIFDWGSRINEESPKWVKMSRLLRQRGFEESEIFWVFDEHPQKPNVYVDKVCTAFLEYYAFEAEGNKTEKALSVFRALVDKTFRDFVYVLSGYQTKQLTFSQYTLSRITNHHNIAFDKIPLPDGYFCLFDKMIEILQKFDLSINYQMTDSWYDRSKGDNRFLEPDISLGRRFSQLFFSNFEDEDLKYQSLYQERFLKKTRIFWNTKLITLKWNRDKALVERNLRRNHSRLFKDCDPDLPIPEVKIDRRQYDFNPSPDSGRNPDYIKPAFCYSNEYSALFSDWLRDVFFRFIWRDYILERDPQGWQAKYDAFKSLPIKQQENILQTAQGKLISGYEYREIWERQLPPTPEN